MPRNSKFAQPKLRSDLQFTESNGGALVKDPISLRQFSFDEMQAEVLLHLDGLTSSVELAEGILGDPEQASAVIALTGKAEALGLLDSGFPIENMQLRAQQAKAMRESAAVQRDLRVAQSVAWAKENLPFYRARLEGLSVESVTGLQHLPFTTKQDIRENFPLGLMPSGVDIEKLVEQGKAVLSTTSGSTGGRLQYVFDLQRKVPASLALEPAFSEDEKIIVFTTPICSGQVCHRGGVPFEERLMGEHRLNLNSSERVMRLSRAHVEECIADIARHQGRVMYVDPVYMAALVRAFQRFDLPLPDVLGVRTGFEYPCLIHKEIIGEALGVPVRPSYGATDLGGPSAISCENGRYHAIENSVVIEFVKDGKVVAPGEIGAMAVTSLRHPYTRLIRYLVGDLGRPIASCGCVWDDWPAFEIEGRLQDVLFATDGSRVTTKAVDDLTRGLKWIDFYELAQKSEVRFHFQAMRREGTDAAADEEVFVERLKGLLGANAEIRIQYVRELPIEQSLKYPLTKQRSREPLKEW